MAVKRNLSLKHLCIFGFVAASIMNNVAYASSDEAWKKHDQDIKAACIKASQLKNAKPASNVMLFDDRVGYSALLIQGKYAQTYMKNQTGQELCIWNKATKKAYLSEVNTNKR